MDYKYSLIVSQYYHSRHMFIVKIDENFIETARKCVEDLEKYKRAEENHKKIMLGDLDPLYSGDINKLRARYNVNDAGDIYFINAAYTNRCMLESWEYKEASRREAVGFKKKLVLEAISKHHDYDKISEIVKKYFEIV